MGYSSTPENKLSGFRLYIRSRGRKNITELENGKGFWEVNYALITNGRVSEILIGK